jgi:hypothetical protein
MNRKKYISAILVLLAFAGSTVLLKLSAMNRTTQGNDSSDWQPDMPVPMDLEQDFDIEDIDSPMTSDDEGAPELAAILGNPGQAAPIHIAPAQGNDPQWFSEITESISHNRIHEAIARIRALDQRNINYQDRDGWTLLHWAVLMRGRWDVCMELLQKGINKNLMNQDGETAADMADELQNPDLANMLNGYK